jgi:hypothetical protein
MTEDLKRGDERNNVVLGDLLPPEAEALQGLIKQHLEKRGVAFGLNYVSDQATAALGREVEKIDLAEQLAKGWVMLKTVRAAKKAPPDERVVLSLGEHHLTLKASPTLKFTIAGVPAPDLTLSLALAAQIDRATLTVLDGALISGDPGDCEMTATLSSGSVVIGHPRSLGRVDLKGPLTFSPPCPIPV